MIDNEAPVPRQPSGGTAAKMGYVKGSSPQNKIPRSESGRHSQMLGKRRTAIANTGDADGTGTYKNGSGT